MQEKQRNEDRSWELASIIEGSKDLTGGSPDPKGNAVYTIDMVSSIKKIVEDNVKECIREYKNAGLDPLKIRTIICGLRDEGHPALETYCLNELIKRTEIWITEVYLDGDSRD